MNKISFSCNLDKIKEICESLQATVEWVDKCVEFTAVYRNTNSELSYSITIDDLDTNTLLFLKLKFGEYENKNA